MRAYNQWVSETLPEVVTVPFRVLLQGRDARYPFPRYGEKDARQFDYPWDYPCVYVIRRHDGEILYVGFTVQPSARMRQHYQHVNKKSLVGMYLRGYRDKTLCWPVDLYPVKSKRDGLALEAKLIDEYQPPLNISGTM